MPVTRRPLVCVLLMAGYPPPVGFNTNLDAPAGYPPQGPMGFPPQGGYPPQGGQMGYPPQGQMGYPPQGQMGYPPQGQMGYPPQGPMGQLPPQGQMGYPPYGGQPGYGGVPPPQGGYTNVSGYGPPQPMGLGYGAGAVAGPSGSCGGGAAMGFLSIYYSGRPTVVPMPCFNPCDDAENLRKAMRGLGTDEGCIIAVLSKRTCGQRSEIAKKYKASFGKDLDKHLKSELSGKFEELVLLSLETLPEMLATTMYDAMKGAGTDERLLIQALVPYSNAIVGEIPKAYNRKYGRDIIADVRSDTSGDFEKILVALLQAQREEGTPVSVNCAAADAEALYKAGEKRLGTEEAVFTRILTQRSFEQIKAICQCYQQKYGKSLETAIKKETSGDYRDTMVSIVRYAEDKNALLATWFYESMVGIGTRDKALMQLVLGRCEIDLQDVKEAYQRKYGKCLVKAIENDTSGDYKRMLVALVGP
ncbi:Annexin B11 [Echinococcus granulosus]|nr:Annexin B11 [Echinococcus granulosus]